MRGTGCYKCAACHKLTRQTSRSGHASAGLCEPCFDLASIQNEHSDECGGAFDATILQCPVHGAEAKALVEQGAYLEPFVGAVVAETKGAEVEPTTTATQSLCEKIAAQTKEIEALKAQVAALRNDHAHEQTRVIALERDCARLRDTISETATMFNGIERRIGEASARLRK
jgi:cell division protein FtsL